MDNTRLTGSNSTRKGQEPQHGYGTTTEALYTTAPGGGNTTLTEALSHARRGTRIFPVHSVDETRACSCSKGADCKEKGKHPRITDNLNSATTDEDVIRKWFERWPDANIATPTGPESGVWVLDVDLRHGGVSSLKRLVHEHGNLGARRVVRTGGGGRHLYFEHPGGFKITSRDNALGKEEYPGLDVKGDGGYVLLPPSNHESGENYRATDRNGKPGPAPEWLLKAVTDQQALSHIAEKRTSKATLVSAGLDSPSIVEGTRNDTLTSIAGKLHDGTRTVLELIEDLFAINEARCPAPLTRGEVEKIARSVSQRAPCRKSSEPPPPEVIGLLGEILTAWWEEEWKGPGGPSERDVILALILVGLSHGRKLPSGNILIPIAFSQLAELARLGSKSTAHRAFFRLREKGWCHGGGNGPNRKPETPTGIVLLPRKPERSTTTASSSTFGVECVPPCAPPSAPRGRHSAPGLRRIATKRRMEAVDYLERAGEWVREENLASMLGIKRARDMRRRYLEPLEKRLVVESSGEEWRLTEGWRLALEKIFAEERDLERALYGGKTSDERLKERHQQEREAYRSRDKVVSERVPTHHEMHEHRKSYPSRRREAIEQAVVRLFAQRPESRSWRIGRITCAIIVSYIGRDFPRGPDGMPKDAEVEAVLRGEPVAA